MGRQARLAASAALQPDQGLATSPWGRPMAGRLRWAVRTAQWSPCHAEFEYLLALCPEEERQAVARFRQVEDRKRALVSRLLARAAAAAALGVVHEAVDVKRTRGGKPYAANALAKPHAPNWNFSMSHEVRQGPGVPPGAPHAAAGIPRNCRAAAGSHRPA